MELSVITEFASGFSFLASFKQQLLSYLLLKKDAALQNLSSLFAKLEVTQLNNRYADPSSIQQFIQTTVNAFTSSLPDTVARMYTMMLSLK